MSTRFIGKTPQRSGVMIKDLCGPMLCSDSVGGNDQKIQSTVSPTEMTLRPVGAAAGCDLLILLLKDRSLVELDSSYRRYLRRR
jgi:hypothetical protein